MSYILTDADLASYLGEEVTPQLTQIATLAGDLVEEAWATPLTPAPVWVKAIALDVASRAFANPKGLTSWTHSWDDISRTERVEGSTRQFGLYLTDDEAARLSGIVPGQAAVGTIQTPLRREVC